MNIYKKIPEARKVLDLPKTASMAAIKSNYRNLLAKWHPDKCVEDPETCAEMTRKIILAKTETHRDEHYKPQITINPMDIRRN